MPDEPHLGEQDAQSSEPGRQADRLVDVGTVFSPRRITSPLDRLTRRTAGKRSATRTRRKRGRYIQNRPLSDGERATDIAFDATFRAAAIHQKDRAGEGGEGRGAAALVVVFVPVASAPAMASA